MKKLLSRLLGIQSEEAPKKKTAAKGSSPADSKKSTSKSGRHKAAAPPEKSSRASGVMKASGRFKRDPVTGNRVWVRDDEE